jgi:hypothetical protein
MSMFLKTYRVNKEVMVAVCDDELLGLTFCEGNLHLSVNEMFFKGDPAGENEVKAALLDATIANLVGNKSVNCGIESGIIDKDQVIMIDGVPHAQMVVL